MTGDPEIAELFAAISSYYTQRVSQYGATPLGADWSCVPTQELRFTQLLKVCDFSAPLSLNDVGCGYGALLSYFSRRLPDIDLDYLGVDLSPAMILKARELWGNRRRTRFIVGHTSSRIADYSVASGVFNVKIDQPADLWEAFIAKTLIDLRTFSRLGFAVNFLAPQEPRQPSREGLYRAQPDPWIRFCKEELNSRVELLGTYGLREFTLLVRF